MTPVRPHSQDRFGVELLHPLGRLHRLWLGTEKDVLSLESLLLELFSSRSELEEMRDHRSCCGTGQNLLFGEIYGRTDQLLLPIFRSSSGGSGRSWLRFVPSSASGHSFTSLSDYFQVPIAGTESLSKRTAASTAAYATPGGTRELSLKSPPGEKWR